MRLLALAADVLLSMLAPPACAACDAPLARARVFCPACAATVLPAPEPRSGASARSAVAYGGAVSTAIARLKYGDRPDLARPLAHLLFPVATALGPIDVVVPVPLHASRLRERGFNQAALLSAPLARHLGTRHAPVLLVRTRRTPPQAELGAAARRTNVVGAFAVKGRAVSGARVLVVDDVRTTGATLDACVVALRAAGAARVSALTLAQSGDA